MNDTRLHQLDDDIRTARLHIAAMLDDASPDVHDAAELRTIENLLAMAARRVYGLMRCTAVTFGMGTRCALPPHPEDVDHRNGELTWTTKSQKDVAKQWGF